MVLGLGRNDRLQAESPRPNNQDPRPVFHENHPEAAMSAVGVVKRSCPASGPGAAFVFLTTATAFTLKRGAAEEALALAT